VLHEGEDISEHSARDRKVGFVFQHYALFRHTTVADNIGYALIVRENAQATIPAARATPLEGGQAVRDGNPQNQAQR
jgi:ABC-type sulfate/molybdate transport systems ATPase subunit